LPTLLRKQVPARLAGDLLLRSEQQLPSRTCDLGRLASTIRLNAKRSA
jgi:hypothetical protein